MPDEPVDRQASDYRLAPALAARFVGGLVVVLAVVLAVVTLLVGLAGLPGLVLVAAAVLGSAAAAVAAYVVTRRTAVVHLGSGGYRVRLIRGAGVTEAGWREVEEAVTAVAGRAPVVILRLRDGRSTTIPVQALAVDREQFVRDLQGHLQRGQGLRPL